jgi:hypothetical protein
MYIYSPADYKAYSNRPDVRARRRITARAYYWRCLRNNRMLRKDYLNKIRKPLSEWTTMFANDPKMIAHILTLRAVRKKRIIKPKTCTSCGKTTHALQLHAHHKDYNKWWEVEWLCSFCHKAMHHTGVHRICLKCKKSFYVAHHRSIDRTRGKYCSLSCFRADTARKE